MTNPTDEIIIKKSKVDKYIGYTFCIIAFFAGLYMLLVNKDWRGFIFVLLCPLIYKWHDEEFRGDPIALKISPEGLWTPKHGYKPWATIKRIKFRYVFRGRFWQTYLDIYRSNLDNPDETLDLKNLNYSKWAIKRRLRKYFNIE
jgi:hypothetical protein